MRFINNSTVKYVSGQIKHSFTVACGLTLGMMLPPPCFIDGTVFLRSNILGQGQTVQFWSPQTWTVLSHVYWVPDTSKQDCLPSRVRCPSFVCPVNGGVPLSCGPQRLPLASWLLLGLTSSLPTCVLMTSSGQSHGCVEFFLFFSNEFTVTLFRG